MLFRSIMALAARTADKMAGEAPRDLNVMPAMPDMALNMVKGMVSMMTSPTNMIREMIGIMTNPVNVLRLGERLLSGRIGSEWATGADDDSPKGKARGSRP